MPGNPLTATGGYEYNRRIIDGLRALGWTVRLRTLDGSFPLPTAQALDDAQRQLAALPADCMVLVDGLALGAMPQVARLHADRLRLIALVHHPLAAETGLPRDLAARLAESERQALQAVRMVVVTSQATRRALADYGVPAHRIAVVEPGVMGPQEPVRGRHAGPPGAKGPLRMVCVATITARKGHDLLVDALAGLRGYAWVLHCVGDAERSPETARELRARIAAAGLEERILLTGELDEAGLARRLGDADLFVLATRYEGYGMAVAQALVYGLPVISTRTGAIAELVGTQAGLLVEPHDGAALREALERVLHDPSLLHRLAASARQVGAGLPGWDVASRRLSAALAAAAQIGHERIQR